MLEKLEALEQHYQEMERLMAQPEVASDYARLQELAKERASLEDTVTTYRQYRRLLAAIDDAEVILADGSDPELAGIAQEELKELNSKIVSIEEQLKLALLPKDPTDDRDIILEIRAGTGGKEAALFAADLSRSYTRYAQSKGWEVGVLDISPSELGGYKEIILEVKGKRVFGRLKYERGVHRVQRIPVTEASGRIHTSTATVAVLPQADEVEMRLNPEDLRTDVYHAGGHGGQNVNKVATAVRVVHIPTGITAVCQDERSQFRNRQKALAILRARILEMERQKQDTEIAKSRRAQVGSAERAEKVRTYNFPQDRVTAHRIGLTLHGLEQILNGNLDELIDALAAADQANRLEEALA